MKMAHIVVAWVLFACAAHVKAVDFSTAKIGGKRLTICRVNVAREQLRLFWRDDAGVPIKRLSRLAEITDARGEKLAFAMNAGMYHGDFSPVGVLVSEGKELSSLNTSKGEGNFFMKPNGVFFVTGHAAGVMETSRYAIMEERPVLATQSGPMLVHEGKVNPLFRPESDSRLYRNGVGAPTRDTAVFVISEDPVNFFEFATFFRDSLHCSEALFLDGTVCSLYAPSLGRNDFRMDLGPMIGVVEKK